MPQKSKRKEKPLTSTTPAVPGQRIPSDAPATALSAMLATPFHPPPNLGPHSFSASRPTLPPLSQIQAQPASRIANSSYPAPPTLYGQTPHHGLPGAHPLPAPQQMLPRLSTDPRSYSATALRPSGPEYHVANTPTEADYSSNSIGRSHNPLKRGPEYRETNIERPQPYGVAQYVHRQPGPDDPGVFRSSPSVSTTSTPTNAHYPTFGQPTFSSQHPAASSTPMSSRVSLHIRQQPRAARAGPDGKDRRPIDPPPVLQLLMTDFDPSNPADIEELQNSYYVVHCRLVSPQFPHRDVSTLSATTDDGSKEFQRLLLGTAVASPHHTKDDPDPSSRPEHPVSEPPANLSGPPSPSSRFLPTSTHNTNNPNPHSSPNPNPSANTNTSSTHPIPLLPKHRCMPNTSPHRRLLTFTTPSTFFIFADISIRKAGEYLLEFNLMKVEAIRLVPGASMPILHTITTDVFKVVNAKDFDQVQPSTRLVRGLIERGAGFPLKLKKGTREGQRRRGAGESEEGDDMEDDDEGSAGGGGSGSGRRRRGGERDEDEMDDDEE